MLKTKGFTLIELMVVIVILGILAAVIAPRIPSFITKAKEGKTKGNLGTLRSTLNIYYSDNDGVYPEDDLSCLMPKYVDKIPDCELPNSPHQDSNKVYRSGFISQTMLVGDLGGWLYGSSQTQPLIWGNIMIDCTIHNDSIGTAWSSY